MYISSCNILGGWRWRKSVWRRSWEKCYFLQGNTMSFKHIFSLALCVGIQKMRHLVAFIFAVSVSPPKLSNFSGDLYLYNKTRHLYICSLWPAKRLDRDNIFCWHSWVAWGWHRLKNPNFIFFKFFVLLFSTGNARPFS